MHQSTWRTIGLVALLLAAPFAASAEGIALNWSACEADGGTSNVAFACNTNAGALALVPSFQLDAALIGVTSVRGTLEVVSETATLPAWWDLDVCRSGSLTTLNSAIGPLQCSFWTGGGFSQNGIDSYVVGLGGPNTARCEFRSFIGQPGRNLSAGTEYVVTALRINFNRTVGALSCAGCGTGVCLELKVLSLQLGAGPTFINLTTPMPTPDGTHVTWQGGGAGPNGSCAAPVPTRRSAWGLIKSLYR
jgi:hypothetical protein